MRFCVIIALCVGAVFVAQRIAQVNRHDNIFPSGVSVDGLDLSGMSYQVALDELTQRYDERLNRTLTLTFQDKSWTFSPALIGATVDITGVLDQAWQYAREGNWFSRYDALVALADHPVELEIELGFDQAAIEAFAGQLKSEIDLSPVDSTLTVSGDAEFEFSASSVGYRLDVDALTAALVQAVKNGESGTIQLQPEVIEPSQTEEKVAASVTRLSSFTTSFQGSSSNRINNIYRALSNFDGLIVQPGETVSFNGVVGKRTSGRGYLPAPEFASGSVIEGIGGGVCQASTTMYGAVLRAGLTIKERNPHSMTVGYVDASQDAAVTDTNKDLKFTNNTGNVIYIFTEVNKNKRRATVSIYGTPVDANQEIHIVSEVLEKYIKSTQKTYERDEDGDQVWYKNEELLLSEGKTGLKSRAFRVYIDKVTGNEVKREQLSLDYYEPQNDVYLVGIH